MDEGTVEIGKVVLEKHDEDFFTDQLDLDDGTEVFILIIIDIQNLDVLGNLPRIIVLITTYV